MRIAINAVSAKMGGALTYLDQLLPQLSRRVVDEEGGSLLVFPGTPGHSLPSKAGIDIQYDRHVSERAGIWGTIDRIAFDQARLPYWMAKKRVDVLYSAANFGPVICPCHQVLLICNTIYFDDIFLGRAHAKVRAKYKLQRALVLSGMAAADALVFPTHAMQAIAMSAMSGLPFRHKPAFVAPFGTRPDLFFPAQEVDNSNELKEPTISLLNVSHYCDQKNLGTLLSSLSHLQKRHPGRFHMTITAGIEQPELDGHPHYPNLRRERDQFRALQEQGVCVDTGTLPFAALPSLYRASNIFVFPSYTESFGFPLVEAMASGLPIVASDIPVMREQCGDAAVYAPVFDAEALAQAIARVADDQKLRRDLRERAIARAKRFTWERHVDILMNAFQTRS